MVDAQALIDAGLIRKAKDGLKVVGQRRTDQEADGEELQKYALREGED